MSTPMAIQQGEASTRIRTIAAGAALIATRTALRSLGFDRTHQLAKRLLRTTRRIAEPDQVLRALVAVDTAASWVPFRVACLERSLAALLVLVARGQATTWHVGVRTEPLAMHAWLVDAAGYPLGEPSEPTDYQPLIVVSPDHIRGDTR